MKYFNLLLIFLCPILCTAQPYFSKHYDINNDAEAGWQISGSDGKIAVLVGAKCNQNTTNCVELLRLNGAGELIWSLLLDTMDVVFQENLISTDTSIYFAGPKQGNQRFGINIMQFDWDGNLIREISLTDSFPHSSINNLSLVDSTLVLSFNKRGDDEHFSATPDTTYYYFMNQQLEYLRHHKISSGTFRYEMGAGYHRAEDGSGYYSDRFGSTDTWHRQDSLDILKFDSLGNLLWSYRVDPEEESGYGPSDIVTTADGGLVALWHVQDWETVEPIYTSPSKLYKLSSEGELEWEYTFNAVHLRNINAIFPANNGDIIGVGINDLTYTPYNPWGDSISNYYAGWIIRMSPEGELLWERTISDERLSLKLPIMQFYHGMVLENDDLMLTGVAYDTFPGGIPAINNPDTWIVHTDSQGCINAGCGEVDVIASTSFAPQKSALPFAVFPNPAGEELTVKLEESIRLPAEIRIVDALGRPLINRQLTRHTASLNIGILPKGVYYVQVRSESGRSGIQKLIKN